MTETFRGRVADAGRVVIPAELRHEFAIGEGDEVMFVRGSGSIEILTVPQALQRVQERVRHYIPGDDVDLTEEILQERKRDAALG